MALAGIRDPGETGLVLQAGPGVCEGVWEMTEGQTECQLPTFLELVFPVSEGSRREVEGG